jgi:two-component system CheB/CheR fusion protein
VISTMAQNRSPGMNTGSQRITQSILSDGRGNAVSVATTERELTDRSMSNAQLRKRVERLAQADRRKNEFLAMLGHELRNPPLIST